MKKIPSVTITFTGQQSLALTHLALLAGAINETSGQIFTFAQQQVVRRAGLAWKEAVTAGAQSPAQQLGRAGGSKTSEAKTAAARANASRPRPGRKKKIISEG